MTAPLKLADGTVVLPALTFNSDPSTGLFKTAGGFAVAISGVKVAEFLSGGVKGARVIGELVPFTGSTAPALFVIPVGQNLSRAAYPDLWAFAQAEIAAGNLFYNNGDGSSTFGIGDMRGRVAAGKDVTAGRLTAATMTPDGNTLGASGGSQTRTLLTANLPPYTPAGTNAATTSNGQFLQGGASDNFTSVAGAGQFDNLTKSNVVSPPAAFTGTAQGGTSVPIGIVQATLVVNYILFAGD